MNFNGVKSTEVMVKANESIKRYRPIETVDPESECFRINDRAVCLKRCNRKQTEKIIKEASSVSIRSNYTRLNKLNKGDYTDSVERKSEVMPDSFNYSEEVYDNCGADDAHDQHLNETASSVETNIYRLSVNNSSVLTDESEKKDCANSNSDGPDSEAYLIVEESVFNLSDSNDDVIIKIDNKKGAYPLVETNLNSLAAKSTNIDTALKRHAVDTESSDRMLKKPVNSELSTESRNNIQTNYTWLSCMERSSSIPLLEDKYTSDVSDMDIESSDDDSDPEFLSSQHFDESNHDDSAQKTGASKPIFESEEVQIYKDVSGKLLAPEDVIVECKDKKNFFYCNVCQCMIHNSMKNVKIHKKGKSHKAAMIKYKKSIVMSANKASPNVQFQDCYIERYKPRGYYCKVCNFVAEKYKVMDNHVRGTWHEANIRIVKGREIIAQKKDEKGVQDEMKELEEKYSKVLEMERLKSWNAYSASIAENPKNEMLFNMEPCYNIQDSSLYSGCQADFQQNQYYQKSMLSTNQEIVSQSSALVNPSMNPDTLMLSQMTANQQAASFFPYSQQLPVSNMLQLQQTSVPNDSKFQQIEVSESLQSEEKTSSFAFPYLIMTESDAEIILQVINSLLQTYLEYKLGSLPKLLFKLSYKPLKSEEDVNNMDEFAIGRTTKGTATNSPNSQNRNCKYRSSFILNDARSSSDIYIHHSDKYIENRSSKRTFINESTSYSEKIHNLPMDSKRYKSYNSYQIEGEPNGNYVMKRQNEKNPSRNVNENEPDINELLHYRSSYKEDGPSNRVRQNELFLNNMQRKYKNSSKEDVSLKLTRQNESNQSSVKTEHQSSLKQYRNSINEDISRKNKPYIKDSFRQYRSFKKENSSARNTVQSEPYDMDSPKDYSSGIKNESSRSTHQNIQSIFDLMKKYKNYRNFPYY